MYMCGIAGAVGISMGPETMAKMLSSMARRGPDGNGKYVGEGCVLLHSRLAIIDPEGGAQPMQAQWGQEAYVLVYNGELYNTEELRVELSREGHRFCGHSDTEVVLHAYAHWGEGCLQKLNGIFAFAVWEQRRRRLFLARDRIGVKPLFYSKLGRGLLFGSEIKTVLCHPDMKPRLDIQGAAQVLLLGPGRIPGSGVFQGIQELKPGCFAYFEGSGFVTRCYWSLKDRIHTDCLDTTIEKVRWLVTDSIRRQTVSDVGLGCFLSGGLDSSIISAVCAQEQPGLHTFSVDYQDNERYFVAGKFQPNADDAYIRLMTEFLQSRQHDTVLTPEALYGHLQAATEARDLPGMADVDFSLLAFCADVCSHVKVALSGECADEIFGGYPWYRDPEVRNTDGFPWAQNTAARSKLIHPQLAQQLDAEDFVRQQYLDTLARCDILPENSPQERRMKEMVNLNFQWFMQTLLDRKDRMSMYQGLEVRVPFCDYRIAEYMYGVPWEFKDLNGREKGLLRRAMSDLLPQTIIQRKKSPYPKTHHPAYLQLVRQGIDKVMERSDAPLFSLISRPALQEYLASTPQWPWYGQLMAMPQTLAYFLQINYWLERYEIHLNW